MPRKHRPQGPDLFWFADEAEYVQDALINPDNYPHSELERCPTCGQLGCVGYCDPADLIEPEPCGQQFPDEPPTEDEQ